MIRRKEGVFIVSWIYVCMYTFIYSQIYYGNGTAFFEFSIWRRVPYGVTRGQEGRFCGAPDWHSSGKGCRPCEDGFLLWSSYGQNGRLPLLSKGGKPLRTAMIWTQGAVKRTWDLFCCPLQLRIVVFWVGERNKGGEGGGKWEKGFSLAFVFLYSPYFG